MCLCVCVCVCVCEREKERERERKQVMKSSWPDRNFQYMKVIFFFYLSISQRASAKSSWADQNTLMECNQMRFIFQGTLCCSPHRLSSVLHGLDLIGKNTVNSRHNVVTWNFQSLNFSTHPRISLYLFYVFVCVVEKYFIGPDDFTIVNWCLVKQHLVSIDKQKIVNKNNDSL